MKILIIGGTGTISSAITRQLAAEGHDLWLLNRGNRNAEVQKRRPPSKVSSPKRTRAAWSAMSRASASSFPLPSPASPRAAT
mgnify:CR=1 FL=1